jgi:hypothetical protein
MPWQATQWKTCSNSSGVMPSSPGDSEASSRCAPVHLVDLEHAERVAVWTAEGEPVTTDAGPSGTPRQTGMGHNSPSGSRIVCVQASCSALLMKPVSGL